MTSVFVFYLAKTFVYFSPIAEEGMELKTTEFKTAYLQPTRP